MSVWTENLPFLREKGEGNERLAGKFPQRLEPGISPASSGTKSIEPNNRETCRRRIKSFKGQLNRTYQASWPLLRRAAAAVLRAARKSHRRRDTRRHLMPNEVGLRFC
jgi:hypothetical protein